jgi:hypothetical protein
MPYCSKCGSATREGAIFCIRCGRELLPEEQVTAAAADLPRSMPIASEAASAIPGVTSEPPASDGMPDAVPLTPPKTEDMVRAVYGSPKISPSASIQAASDKNWFERHLNWTWMFGLITFYFIQIVATPSRAGYLTTSQLEEAYNTSFTVWLLSLCILYLPLTGWVLRQKGRSLWFLLISGFLFLPLWIENKNPN